MKKFLSALLSLMLIFSLVSLAGCGETETETLKFGVGIFSQTEESKDADGDTNGEGNVVITVAAVLVDKDGKIVSCTLDVADLKAGYTSDGKFVEAGELKTKRELGDDYGMVKYQASTKEWYEQADAFISQCIGKTKDEIASLVVNGKGNDDVVAAGCTIYVSEFAAAVELAAKNAAASDATADDKINLGIVSVQTDSKDATEEALGVNEIDTTVAAAVVDKDGKVVVMYTDALQTKFKFDQKGKADTEAFGAVSKKEAGDNYGMAQYGQDLNGDGKVLEWYAQAEAFNAACVGKNAAEIGALVADKGYGVDSLQTAGCTINVSDMVKAAVKAATVA